MHQRLGYVCLCVLCWCSCDSQPCRHHWQHLAVQQAPAPTAALVVALTLLQPLVATAAVDPAMAAAAAAAFTAAAIMTHSSSTSPAVAVGVSAAAGPWACVHCPHMPKCCAALYKHRLRFQLAVTKPFVYPWEFLVTYVMTAGY